MLNIVVARGLASGLLETARIEMSCSFHGKGIKHELLLSKSHNAEDRVVAVKLAALALLSILKWKKQNDNGAPTI